jgi:deoxyribonuclease-4
MTHKIGAHLSTAGGYTNALDSIVEKGGNTLQIFSTSPRNWKAAMVTDVTAKEFVDKKHTLGIDPVFFHATYLINLADEGRIGHISKTMLIAEMNLQPRMEVSGSVVHLGSFKEKDKDDTALHGKNNSKYSVLIKNMKEVLEKTPHDSYFLMENSATRKIGRTIEELADIMTDVGSDRLKICLDTCHLHAAGYDLKTQESFDAYFNEFDKKIGLDKIAVIHMNDSRDPFGSLRDRHENLKEGFVGENVFWLLLNDKKTRDIPFILEVPGFDGNGPDKENLDIVKSLITS